MLTRLRQREDLQVAEVRTELDKLFKIVGNVDRVFFVVAAMVVVIGVISVMVSIYNTMSERRREIAILRAIGARRTTVMSAIVGEAAVLSFCGALAGLLLAHGLVAVAGAYIEQHAGFRPDPFRVLPIEIPLVGVVTMVGALAGVVPAWKAYRTDVATNLAPLS